MDDQRAAGTPRIGIIGGYGAVGSAAAEQLAAWDVGRLRIGGRDAGRAAATAQRLGAHAEPAVVDVADPASLARFAAGCQLLVNCAGPAAVVKDAVATAAFDAGVDYVDAAGDDALFAQIAARGGAPPRRAVISAGMMPGLTGLLPRLFTARLTPPLRLTGWVGGRDHFTPTAAWDYLATEGDFGQRRAAWRHGRRAPDAVGATAADRAPFFPGPVATVGYLSTEAERLAETTGLAEATWFSVFDGEQLWEALSRPAGGPDADLAARAGQLSRAAALDLFGATAYQLIVVEVAGGGDPTGAERPTAQTVLLRGTGASQLTGAAAALAAQAVLAGAVPPGTHHAAEVLDPHWTVRRLRECAAVEIIELLEGTAVEAAAVEEGVL